MAVQITKTFLPKSQDHWKSWLEKNHDSKKEIWVVFYKKATGKQTISYQEVLDCSLCFGWIDGIEKRIDGEKYALRFTPRGIKSKWSEYNVRRYKELLKKGLIENAGKKAFKNKGVIYTVHSMTKEAVAWHLANKMPNKPTLEQRVTWHKEHQRICGCRPIPKTLEKYFPK